MITAMVALSVCALPTPQAGHYPVKIVGARHTLVLFSDGTLTGWGPCDRGELGPIAEVKQNRNWATAPVKIKLPRKAIDVAAAEGCSFALLDDGTVVAWGMNYNKMLGTEEPLKLSNGVAGSETPVPVPGLAGIANIEAGGYYALAMTREGKVYGWGLNFERSKPELIDGLSNVREISASPTHVMALDSSGNVWTLGGAMYGALGRMTNPDKAEKVNGLSNIKAIAAGLGVSTAVKSDGTVWVWGSNWHGQFGNGDRTDAPVYGGLQNDIQLKPSQVPGVKNVVAVSNGEAGRHTLALLKDGSLKGWGNTDWGQLGAGVSGTFQLSPVTPKITGVKAAFAVGNNSFAIKKDNSLWIWGNGHRGEFPLQKVTKTPVALKLP